MPEATPGATPADGATPSEPPVNGVPQAGATPADDGLGDAGKRAIDAMKVERDNALKAAKAAEKALAEHQAANATEAEKALAKARADGAAEVLGKAQEQVRRSEVRAALATAGLPADLVGLASKDDIFAKLTVNEDGEVEGLDGAVAAFKKSHATLFATQPIRTDSGLGPRGAPAGQAIDMNQMIRQATGRG